MLYLKNNLACPESQLALTSLVTSPNSLILDGRIFPYERHAYLADQRDCHLPRRPPSVAGCFPSPCTRDLREAPSQPHPHEDLEETIHKIPSWPKAYLFYLEEILRVYDRLQLWLTAVMELQGSGWHHYCGQTGPESSSW